MSRANVLRCLQVWIHSLTQRVLACTCEFPCCVLYSVYVSLCVPSLSLCCFFFFHSVNTKNCAISFWYRWIALTLLVQDSYSRQEVHSVMWIFSILIYFLFSMVRCVLQKKITTFFFGFNFKVKRTKLRILRFVYLVWFLIFFHFIFRTSFQFCS